jgi:uncharacterized protein YicC (UPF0701 family)
LHLLPSPGWPGAKACLFQDTATPFQTKTNPMPYYPGENQMSENIAQTVQKVIQDLVAPDVRELKTLVVDLQKQIDQRFDAQDKKIDAQDKKIDVQFKALNQKIDAQFNVLMAAFGEFKAQNELTNLRTSSALSERIAVLESHQQ